MSLTCLVCWLLRWLWDGVVVLGQLTLHHDPLILARWRPGLARSEAALLALICALQAFVDAAMAQLPNRVREPLPVETEWSNMKMTRRARRPAKKTTITTTPITGKQKKGRKVENKRTMKVDESQCRSKAETCCHGKSVEVGQVDSCMFRSTLSH